METCAEDDFAMEGSISTTGGKGSWWGEGIPIQEGDNSSGGAEATAKTQDGWPIILRRKTEGDHPPKFQGPLRGPDLVTNRFACQNMGLSASKRRSGRMLLGMFHARAIESGGWHPSLPGSCTKCCRSRWITAGFLVIVRAFVGVVGITGGPGCHNSSWTSARSDDKRSSSMNVPINQFSVGHLGVSVRLYRETKKTARFMSIVLRACSSRPRRRTFPQVPASHECDPLRNVANLLKIERRGGSDDMVQGDGHRAIIRDWNERMMGNGWVAGLREDRKVAGMEITLEEGNEALNWSDVLLPPLGIQLDDRHKYGTDPRQNPPQQRGPNGKSQTKQTTDRPMGSPRNHTPAAAAQPKPGHMKTRRTIARTKQGSHANHTPAAAGVWYARLCPTSNQQNEEPLNKDERNGEPLKRARPHTRQRRGPDQPGFKQHRATENTPNGIRNKHKGEPRQVRTRPPSKPHTRCGGLPPERQEINEDPPYEPPPPPRNDNPRATRESLSVRTHNPHQTRTNRPPNEPLPLGNDDATRENKRNPPTMNRQTKPANGSPRRKTPETPDRATHPLRRVCGNIQVVI
ncbi:hypothetical protein BS47DRAFT_1368723 [Hydnum rufescens UP504]|uniref:Uncharacterized protein n=1 Tax=Hydnum rufescens UP504 TaxID=1448309 RepID=A0A9P6DJ48_9AGAM|nr:hypothetical protein BS47DRAFT_1368723 [Hydnum rufescens UP504]